MSMDVMLSEEEISFRNEFRAFLGGLDLSFILRMDKEDEKEFPKDFVRALGQNNYLGIPLPKNVGGRGLNTVCAILAEEELGALAFPLGCAMGMSTYLCRAIYKYGNSELWKKYIIPTMKADLICAEGITEPLKGSDIARLQTVAKRAGNHCREPSILRAKERMSLTSKSGIPYLAPELVLLFKSRNTSAHDRPKDQSDFERVFPNLEPERRAWLYWALTAISPGHDWIRHRAGALMDLEIVPASGV